MIRQIEIRDIKSIKTMVFNLPSEAGTYVLTSKNGVGKTTLMACLERISNSNAFQYNFRTSVSSRFDDFSKGKIFYQLENERVEYSYSGSRWTPKPRSKANILKGFGYKECIFVKSSGERFYIQEHEIDTNAIKATSDWLRNSASTILQNDKFRELRTIVLGETRGRGGARRRTNNAFLLPTANRNYYSEKNFSLGELVVLNALIQLEHVQNGSLVLIDELELALHPQVQIKMLEFVTAYAVSKQLTVIFSTHSSSLIKCSDNIIYIENKSGNVVVHNKCFPAYALQSISFRHDYSPDLVFLVEDEMALCLLSKIFIWYIANVYKKTIFPVYKIYPVGGYTQTMDLKINLGCSLLSEKTKIICVLDADAGDSINVLRRKKDKTESEVELLNKYDQWKNEIYFLPITPELGFIEFFLSKGTSFDDDIKIAFDNRFTGNFSEIIKSKTTIPKTPFDNQRKEAKFKFDKYVELIKSETNQPYEVIVETLISFFTKKYFAENETAQNQMKAMFGKVISALNR